MSAASVNLILRIHPAPMQELVNDAVPGAAQVL